jgi:hypothetical protein
VMFFPISRDAKEKNKNVTKPMNSNRQTKYLMNERGNMLLAAGALSLMLLFAMFAVNAAYYYTYQRKLDGVASSVASFAGTFLPNPSLSAQAAVNAFAIFKNDLVKGNQHFDSTLSLELSVEYFEVGSGGAVELKRTILSSPASSWPVKLPIKSLTVRVSGEFPAQLLNFSGSLGSDLTSLTVRGEATTQLAPTDIVLVIDNSNSVISPLADESAGVHAAFQDWSGDVPGRGDSEDAAVLNTYGHTWDTVVSKARLRERQCYGSINKDIKRAALQAFDYLTSVGTYRVGVVHAKSGLGEFPTATINITSDSYGRVYRRKRVSTLLPGATTKTPASYDEVFYHPGSNSSYGSFEFPESRCAALTSSASYAVPAHPFSPYATLANFGVNTLRTNLAPLLKCDGAVNSTTCPQNGHLELDTAETLLPREVLWMNNAGETFESGLPNPFYDYVNMEFAILRAMDMLRTAPARLDKLPVRRQLVLVFTDGVEQPFSQETGTARDDRGIDIRFQRIPEIAASSAAFSEKIYGLNYDASGQLFERYCSTSESNSIYTLTEPETSEDMSSEDNNQGIKVGVIYHGNRFVFSSNDTDPTQRLANLNGHGDLYLSVLNQFQTECNTRWTSKRGRFFVEISPYTVTDEVALTGSFLYYEQLVPQVLRSIYVSELIRTNAS